MNDLDERLARAGEQFRGAVEQPPSLDAMLDGATRPRHRARVILPVAASVLAVAGVAIAGPLARSASHGHRSSPASAAVGPGGAHYVGDERWSAPVLDESHSNVVYVNAEVQPGAQGSWGTSCGVQPVARVVAQTQRAVTIAVGKYAKPPKLPPGSQLSCAAIKLPPERLTIVLSQPLGSRSLIDATDGASRPVLDPATVLEPSEVPAGYQGGQPSWGGVDGGASTAIRTYQGPGSELTVTVGPASITKPLRHVVEHTTVRGHPATVSYDSGFAQDVLIAWNEDATHAATLYQTSHYDQKHPALSVAQLIRIAQGLH
jgi:hypothetical protein